jgi:hypothetical protein
MKNLGFYWWTSVNSSKEGDWYVEWLEGIRVRFGAQGLRLE